MRQKDRTESSCFKNDLSVVSVFSLQHWKYNIFFSYLKFDTIIKWFRSIIEMVHVIKPSFIIYS